MYDDNDQDFHIISPTDSKSHGKVSGYLINSKNRHPDIHSDAFDQDELKDRGKKYKDVVRSKFYSDGRDPRDKKPGRYV